MPVRKWQHLDEHLRLSLAELDPHLFEQFFLLFLRSGIALSIERHGSLITRRIISAETYAAGSGRNQKGIDLRVVVEGGEVWVFQCKRHKTWTPSQTRDAIQKASQYKAEHYFLVVACDPHESVQDEIHKYPNWTFWNLDTICAEFRLRVHPSKHAQILFFLSPEELKRFVPFTTEALITPAKFFERFLGTDKLFRHDWKLVGRDPQLRELQDFTRSPHKAQVLIAKGGDGKSRLLWEFCQTLAAQTPEMEILCLNPHRGGDDMSFAFTGNPPNRIILVDDAHRTEQVPLQLLALVRDDPVARIVLATRPQGVEALAQKLYEAGLANNLARQVSLPRLEKADVKSLASEALGEGLKEHAQELAELTMDCPFLTVIAGELLQLGRMGWGRWASHEEFRQHVFREFEQRNLETVPEADRSFASGLMQMLSLLAPVVINPRFPEKAARSLGCSVFTLETQMNRLRQSEVAAGRDDGLRIVPDLFADFLVYDVCYGPKKMPGFVQQVMGEFEDRSAALLRNLSEATWVARANNVADEVLLNTVIEPERRRFETASFYKKAELLRHWSGFSVYLPAESLELARMAITIKTAPVDDTQQVISALGRCDHDYVSEQIPTLIKPIAKHHDQYRFAALDLLWELGLTKPWAEIGSNQNHPWAVISDVIKFEPKKPVFVTLNALTWLDKQLREPRTLQALEGTTPVLRALIGPCFERVVEFSWSEGRTVHFCRTAVSIENTRPIRERALEIIGWVIQEGSPLAALDALSALQPAIQRVGRFDAGQNTDEAQLRAEWLPERLKALVVYEKAIEKHSSIAVRYEIRQTLKRDLAYEEEPKFADECRRVLAKLPDDLIVRVAVVILSQDAFEFTEEAAGPHAADRFDSLRALWNERVHETARQLVTSYSEAGALWSFLNKLARELVEAGYHALPGPLFTDLAQTAPELAAGLARQILESGDATSPLAHAWPALIENNTRIRDAQRVELLRKGANSGISGASAAVIRAISGPRREDRALNDAEKSLLLEIAARASADEAFYLLQFVEWSAEANLPWAFQILEALPLGDVAPGMLERVLHALVPYKERKTSPPLSIIHHVLTQLISVRDLDLFHHSREWDALAEKYPREVFELLRSRIVHAASGKTAGSYNPIPHGYHRQIDLSSLVKESDYAAICDDLWSQISDSEGPNTYCWVRLFQAVIFENPQLWPPRMLGAIARAGSSDELLWLVQLLRFEGSLVIFRFPEIARAFLDRGQALGGDHLRDKVRVGLYSACGPQTRLYSGGILDKELDYVEAEASKAAEAHASDELLGPFYRWIVEVEQKERLMHKMHADAAMNSLD